MLLVYIIDDGLEALRKALDNQVNKKISANDLTKMTEFLSENKYFEFNGKVKKQISGTAIGTKLMPQHTCIFID